MQTRRAFQVLVLFLDAWFVSGEEGRRRMNCVTQISPSISIKSPEIDIGEISSTYIFLKHEPCLMKVNDSYDGVRKKANNTNHWLP